MRVLFHRDFRQFQGGHLKVWHYFNHVKATPGYEAKIFFTPESVWDRSNPWFSLRQEALDSYDFRGADMLFIAGQDWLALPEEIRKHPTVPVVNFLQHVRHADRETSLYSYLVYPALRIAVSEEVGAAVSATGRVNGPVICISNGISLEELPPPVPWPQRDVDVVVCALKNRALGGAVADRLREQGYCVSLLNDRILRAQYLSHVGLAKVAVLIPNPAEGFYLPALEAMAMGVLTVCPDCIGNRSFCLPGETAEVPEWNNDAFVSAAQRLLERDEGARKRRLRRAKEVSEQFSLERERRSFQAILRQFPALWRDLV